MAPLALTVARVVQEPLTSEEAAEVVAVPALLPLAALAVQVVLMVQVVEVEGLAQTR